MAIYGHDLQPAYAVALFVTLQEPNLMVKGKNDYRSILL